MTLSRSLLAAALMLAAGAASAQSSYYDDDAYDSRHPAYEQGPQVASHSDVARVLSVDPIVEPGEQQTRQECWREDVPRQAGYYDERYQRYPQYAQAEAYPRERRGNGTGAVLGGLVGAALGNTVGSGDGRRAATVVGAVIGASIGHNIQNGGYDPRYQDRDDERYRRGYGGYDSRGEIERCRTVVDYQQDERVAGYRVTYEYAGRRYETITDYHPGNQLRVRVDVTPEQ